MKTGLVQNAAQSNNDQTERICNVCNIPLAHNFCPTCGQKLKKEETTIRSIFSDFFQNLFSLDKSVFISIFRLVTDPKNIITNYWSGYRRYYPSPGKFLVYAITIAAIHLTFINDDLLGLTFDLGEVKGQFIFWLFFFPIMTLASFLAFFKQKLNFAKHVISIAYISSSFYIIITIIHDILISIGFDLSILPFIFFLLFVFIWNALVHTPQSKLKVLLYTIIQLLSFALIIISFLGLVYLLYPESVKWS